MLCSIAFQIHQRTIKPEPLGGQYHVCSLGPQELRQVAIFESLSPTEALGTTSVGVLKMGAFCKTNSRKFRQLNHLH
jgi:hypothetical protein